MTQEQQEQFIKWLNYELSMAISMEDGSRAHALVQAKEKFQSILTTPTTTN